MFLVTKGMSFEKLWTFLLSANDPLHLDCSNPVLTVRLLPWWTLFCCSLSLVWRVLLDKKISSWPNVRDMVGNNFYISCNFCNYILSTDTAFTGKYQPQKNRNFLKEKWKIKYNANHNYTTINVQFSINIFQHHGKRRLSC